MVVFGLGRTTKVLLVLCLLGTATLVLSEGTERYFWHNEVSGESVWHYPQYKHWSAEHSKYYYVDPDTKETTWELPEKYAWEEFNDVDSGKTYYHNKQTGKTSWDKPEQFAWKRVVHKDNDEL